MFIFVIWVLYFLFPVLLFRLEHIFIDAFTNAVKHDLVSLFLEQLVNILGHLCITYGCIITLLSLRVHKVPILHISVCQKSLELLYCLAPIVFKKSLIVFMVWSWNIRVHGWPSTSWQEVRRIHVCYTESFITPIEGYVTNRAEDLENYKGGSSLGYFMFVSD